LWIGALRDNYVIVFDNADILTPEELEQYFPPGLGGNILITSRNSAMQCLTSPANCLEVKEMKESDAILLLLKASCLDIAQTDDLHENASEIVKGLFCVPLAIDQAGAIIRSGAITMKDYLGIYCLQQNSLLSHPEFKGGSKYNRSVYGTWELLYKEIQQRAKSADVNKARAAKNAILILAIFSFFHYDAINEDIFSNAAVQKGQTRKEKKSWLGFLIEKSTLPLASSKLDHRLLPLNDAGVWNNLIFKEGIQLLLSFCFIRLGSCDGEYAVHPLIHAWYRDRMTSKERKEFCLMAYVMLACSIHKDFHQQPYSFRRGLVAHIKANIKHNRISKQEVADSYFDDASEKFVCIFREQGHPKEAEIIAIKMVDARRKISGKNNQSTISAVECLSKTYRDLGKYTEAEKLQKQCLNTRIRLFGEEHQDTIIAMASLGYTYKSIGKYREAEKLETKVLDATIRILGKVHPDTTIAMGNLAATYRDLGKYVEAEKLQKQCLDTRIRLLGKEHPQTITAMAQLGCTYENIGKYREAEELETKVLDARIRILGKDHPYAAFAMGRLAETYHNLGKYEEAEQLHKQCLNTCIRLLGEEHPHTMTAMAQLGYTYESMGKYREAEELETKVLDVWIRNLGKDHPYTAYAMGRLAETYTDLGKFEQAEQLHKKCLNTCIRLLGEEHPYTITAMAGLGHTYESMGKYREAEQLGTHVLDASIRILGKKHPDTIRISCSNI
jgi:tetratricopeptide (TPR) repeat protein